MKLYILYLYCFISCYCVNIHVILMIRQTGETNKPVCLLSYLDQSSSFWTFLCIISWSDVTVKVEFDVTPPGVMFPCLPEQTHLSLRTEMEVSASRFRIDCLLSVRPPGALLPRVDPPDFSPGGSSGCSAPPPEQRERVPRLESALLPAHLQQLQPRTASSSFLIRDILADCRSYSDPGQPELEPEPFQSGQEEDYQDKTPESRGRRTGSPKTIKIK